VIRRVWRRSPWMMLYDWSHVGFMVGRERDGFTFLEVMVALAIIAVALTAVLGLQAQSVSMASEAKFYTIAPLLAQSKMAEMEMMEMGGLASSSGDFGEDFPGYFWEISISDVFTSEPQSVSKDLERIDVKISWGEEKQNQYVLRLYDFRPKNQ
jgi:type II secretion system protein I